MSTVASLQIKLGADVSSAINGMSKSEFAALKVADSFNRAAEASQQYGTLAAVAGNRVAQAAQGAQSILNNIKFDRISTEGEKSFNSLQRIVDAAANVGNAATLMGSGFVQAQNIANVALTAVGAAIPRVGIAIAGMAGPIGLAVGAVGALVGGLIAWKTAQDNTIDSQRELNNKISEQISSLDAEFAVLRNANLSYETRGQLIDKVNDKYGTTIKNLKDETQFANQLGTAYENVAASIKNKILIEANQERIKELITEITSLEKISRGFNSKKIDDLTSKGASPGQIEAYNKPFEDAKNRAKELNGELSNILNDTAKLFNDAFSGGDDKGKGKGKGESNAKVDEIKKAYQDLENTLIGIQTRLSQGLIEPLDVTDLKIDAFTATIDKLINIDPDGSAAQQAIDRYKALFDRSQIEIKPLVRPEIAQLENIGTGNAEKSAVDSIQKKFNEQLAQLKINALPDGTNALDDFVDKYAEKIGKAVSITSQLGGQLLNIANLAGNFEGRLNELDNYYSREQELIESSVASESVKAARKKSLEEDVNRKRKSILREQAQQQKVSAIFNAIINTATAVTKALAEGGPAYAAIVGALGAVEIGIIAGQPIPALASGALISGPNTVLVGEYSGASSNPELISPVDKVKKYIVEAVESAGSGASNLVGILRNDDLYFMMERAQQRKFRTG